MARATKSQTPALKLRPNPHLYEINTWVWLDDLSRGAGKPLTLGTVPDAEWDRLAACGIDLVYLMGVWDRSLAGRAISRTSPELFPVYDQALPGWTMRDVVGSPYSVRNYVPDAHLGGWRDLDTARAKLRQRGMGLILDFVGNHTGHDHPWIAQHPEFFVQGTMQQFRRDPQAFLVADLPSGDVLFIARGRDPFFPPWSDSAQLNYFNPATRAALIDTLRSIADHCDGVRCDMAMLALNDVFQKTWAPNLSQWPAPATEFWSEALPALPDFIWIAEVYWDLEWRMQQLGFHYTYDKRLYDRLVKSPPQEIRAHLQADYGYQSRMARFLENHDEPRAATIFPGDKLRAAAITVGTLPGLRFYHQGQFEGRRLHSPVQLARVAPELPDNALQQFYAKVLAISGHDVFHSGEWKLLDISAAGDKTFQNLLAWRWKLGSELWLVVVNLCDATSQGQVQIAAEVNASQSYLLRDELNGPAYRWNGRDIVARGLYVRLAAYGCHVFDVKPAI
jgi:glycosidase